MPTPNSHLEIKNAILLIALDLCFTESDSVLAAEQIALRKFTPSDSYSYRCIADLLEAALVKADHIPSLLGQKSREHESLAISRPVFITRLGNDRKSIIDNLALTLRRSPVDLLFFRRVQNELVACECISYAEYYSKKEGLEITNTNPYDRNVHALILEISREQVFMLLWRAVKSYSKTMRGASNHVTYKELTTMSIEYYERYCIRDAKIERYGWPEVLPFSKLSLTLKKIESLI